MSTAQIIYEQYKVLPPKVRKELMELINNQENPVLVSIKKGLQEIEKIKAGKKKGKTLDELLERNNH